jgi:hypothetical protein
LVVQSCGLYLLTSSTSPVSATTTLTALSASSWLGGAADACVLTTRVARARGRGRAQHGREEATRSI